MANVFGQFPELIRAVGRVPRHLVHVGAHEGQEVPFYRAAGVPRITLVEPIPQLAARLSIAYRRRGDVQVVTAACGSEPGRAQLHVMKRTNLSTLEQPGRRDRVDHTLTVDVRRLDELAPGADAAVIDAQGRELDVLAAAPFESLHLVIVETSTVDDATLASPYGAVSEFMTARGFREMTRWVRDYDWLNRWARGPGQPRVGGEVRDVAYVRDGL